MPDLSNADVSAALDRFASLSDIAGDSPFRTRAYRRAAETVRHLPEPIAEVAREGRLREVPGVGEGLAAAIGGLLSSGAFPPLVELSRRVPATLLDLLELPGVGVKTVARLHDQLGVVDLPGLEAAIAAGRVRDAKGLGARIDATVRAGLETFRRRTGRTPLGTALPLARALASSVSTTFPEALVAIAGGVRRMEETVGDIDLVVGSPEPASAAARLAAAPPAGTVIEAGPDRVRLRLPDGPEADLYVAPRDRFGSALVRATGSEAHLELLGAPLPDVPTEAELYAARGRCWVPPELRRGRDEFAREAEIAGLVSIADVAGEFHCHTLWSDGSASVAEMAGAATERGYRFLAISDHSQGLGVAHGLDPARLAAQRAEIAAAGGSGPLRLLAGAEVEVARDGRLDLPDEVLAGLDVVVASLHSGLRLPRSAQTERLLRVLANPHVDIVAHPTGRLIERREGGDFDWDRVFPAAAATGVALEINAHPARLDLDDRLAEQAAAAGCLLSINCDAHHPDGFAMLEYGVAVARRAWLRPDRIVNCWEPDRVAGWLAHRDR